MTLRLGRRVVGSQKVENEDMRPCDLATRSLGRRVAEGGKTKICDLVTLRLGRWVVGSQKAENQRYATL